MTLRLRNLESGVAEFLRLSLTRLQGRACSGVVISDAAAHGVPVLVLNETRHELHLQQAGVPLVTTVPPGGAMPYAWDEPSRRQTLALAVPALNVRFRCGTAPARLVRPRFAGITRVPSLECRVSSEGATTRIVVSPLQLASSAAGLAPPTSPGRPLSPALNPLPSRDDLAEAQLALRSWQRALRGMPQLPQRSTT